MNKKTVIFYFSQSGNSLFVAKKIAEGIGNATLVSIPEAIHNNSYSYINYQSVGIILPLYFMSIPVMVRDFISKLEISKDSYIKWNEAPTQEKVFKINENADKSLDLLIEKIICQENFVEKEGGLYKFISLLVYKVWESRLKTISKCFKVNNLCVGCGICEKTCPSRNIKLENAKPKWSNKCQDCMACVQHCPKKAIFFNSKTIKKRRYINPNIE